MIFRNVDFFENSQKIIKIHKTKVQTNSKKKLHSESNFAKFHLSGANEQLAESLEKGMNPRCQLWVFAEFPSFVFSPKRQNQEISELSERIMNLGSGNESWEYAVSVSLLRFIIRWGSSDFVVWPFCAAKTKAGVSYRFVLQSFSFWCARPHDFEGLRHARRVGGGQGTRAFKVTGSTTIKTTVGNLNNTHQTTGTRTRGSVSAGTSNPRTG